MSEHAAYRLVSNLLRTEAYKPYNPATSSYMLGRIAALNKVLDVLQGEGDHEHEVTALVVATARADYADATTSYQMGQLHAYNDALAAINQPNSTQLEEGNA